MKQPLFIQNTPIDEKRISFIEKVVSRLSRRSGKVAKAMISPIPISICVFGEEISGNIMKSLLFKGTVVRGIVQLGEKPKGVVRIEIKISDGAKMDTKAIYLDKQRGVIDLNLPVLDGSVLSISIYPENEADKITEIMMSVLWTPDKTEIDVKNFLIDELEEQSDAYLIED